MLATTAPDGAKWVCFILPESTPGDDGATPAISTFAAFFTRHAARHIEPRRPPGESGLARPPRGARVAANIMNLTPPLPLWKSVAAAVLACLATITCPSAVLADNSAPNSNFASRMLEATFKFFHPNSTSTCFLIAVHEHEHEPEPGDDAGTNGDQPDDQPREPVLYLVSSGHTFERTSGETAVLVLREPDGNGSYTRRDHTIPIRDGDQPLWIQHENEDVGVLRLTDPLPVEVNALPLSAVADETAIHDARLQIGDTLLILTFPHRFEAHPSGLPVARQGIFASPPQLPVSDQPNFLADFTTFSGDSGGPAFIAADEHQPLLVGVVIAEVNHNTTMSDSYEERRIRYPLNLGRVVHASFIRETIEAAQQAATKPEPDPDSDPDSDPEPEPDPEPDPEPTENPDETPTDETP